MMQGQLLDKAHYPKSKWVRAKSEESLQLTDLQFFLKKLRLFCIRNFAKCVTLCARPGGLVVTKDIPLLCLRMPNFPRP